jgi:hypothetical protein
MIAKIRISGTNWAKAILGIGAVLRLGSSRAGFHPRFAKSRHPTFGVGGRRVREASATTRVARMGNTRGLDRPAARR